MLTNVILEGPMGKACGRKWVFDISSPAEALRMVEANKPGVFAWIKKNLEKYEAYRVICKYENGKEEELDSDSYALSGKPTEIRFVPLIEGAGAVGRIIMGAILIAVAFTPFGAPFAPYLIPTGISLILGGVVQLLTPQPKLDTNQSESKNKTSYFFDGPVNTTEQGVPVQLIYGDEVLVGSHAISAQVTIDQLL